MKTTKRNKKDLIDIDIIDLNGSSKDGGKKKSAGKKTASAKKTAGGRSTASGAKASGTKASGRKAAAGKSAKGRQGSAGASASGGESAAPVRRKGNREFAVITYFFLALFICLSGYFVYFLQFKSEDFINNPYNARLATLSDTVIRGRILSADGQVLARTDVAEDGTETRVYPYGPMFAHAVGYNVNGMAGVELDGNFNLLRSNAFVLERLVNEITGQKNQGDDLVTTLNYNLQETAYDGMGSYDGAVVALEPSTGKILAMVSKPDFNPNSIAKDWDSLISGDSSELVNRATQGLYPPGSTFKIVTALAYMREHPDYANYTFDCTGTYNAGGYTIHCTGNEAHGHQTFLEAFANSCNCAFSDMGLSLNVSEYGDVAEDLLFNHSLPTSLGNVNASSFALTEQTSPAEIMQTSIGQGTTLTTPLHMAMIVSAIANGGELMEPYIIDHSMNNQQQLVKQYDPQSYGNILSASEASALQELMRAVVTEGTGTSLQSDRYTVYGKTGTAEYTSDKDNTHSWFVGYAADASGKEIAVAVIMEGAGYGSRHAVPLAKKMFDVYFQ